MTQFLVSVDQCVPLCKISGLCVQRLRFMTPINVTDRPTDRWFCTEYMNSSADCDKDLYKPNFNSAELFIHHSDLYHSHYTSFSINHWLQKNSLFIRNIMQHTQANYWDIDWPHHHKQLGHFSEKIVTKFRLFDH